MLVVAAVKAADTFPSSPVASSRVAMEAISEDLGAIARFVRECDGS